MPFPAKTNFKKEFFKAIKEGDDVLEMWCRHIGRHQFLKSCGLFIHSSMPHKISLFSTMCTYREITSLHVTLDWLRSEVEVVTLPDERIKDIIFLNSLDEKSVVKQP